MTIEIFRMKFLAYDLGKQCNRYVMEIRVRAVFIRLLKSAMFVATLNLVTRVGLTLFLES